MYRKSSGFSRGASMYRGVTRFLLLFISFYVIEPHHFFYLFWEISCTFFFVDIISMEDGRPALAGLLEIRTFILEHLVSYWLFWISLKHFFFLNLLVNCFLLSFFIPRSNLLALPLYKELFKGLIFMTSLLLCFH